MAARKTSPAAVRPTDTFGARLAVMRQAKGAWNIKRAAEFCGIDDGAWRNWESGRSLPRDYLRICHVIADRLGFEFEWVALGGPLAAPSTRWKTAVAA
jgi:hypothetical protein